LEKLRICATFSSSVVVNSSKCKESNMSYKKGTWIALLFTAVMCWSSQSEAEPSQLLQTPALRTSGLNNGFEVLRQSQTQLEEENLGPMFGTFILSFWDIGVLIIGIGNVYALRVGGGEGWGVAGVLMGVLGIGLDLFLYPPFFDIALLGASSASNIGFIVNILIHAGLVALGVWNMTKKETSVTKNSNRISSVKLSPWATVNRHNEFNGGMVLTGRF
jgi:hypothetical protein